MEIPAQDCTPVERAKSGRRCISIGQRSLRNPASAAESEMRKTLAGESVLCVGGKRVRP